MKCIAHWFCIYLLSSSVTTLAQQTLQVPAAYPSIQSAINAASAGDVVAVAPGMYKEVLNFLGKAITVEGTGTQQEVVIDSEMTGPVVSMVSGEGRGSVLKNLTLQHGSSANPGATIEPTAGGIFMLNSSPSIVDVTIQDTYECGIGAYQSAPLIEGGTVAGTTDSGTVEGCPLQENAGSSYARGTAILLDGRSSTGLQTVITGNVITENADNGNEGGGVQAPGIDAVDAGSVLISGNVITGDTGSLVGGSAINVEGNTSPSILQNLVFGNIETTIPAVFNLSGSGSEAAVNIAISTGYTAYVTGNTIATNHYINGPGVNIVQGTQLFLSNTGTAVVSNNLFIGPNAVAPVYCAASVAGMSGTITFSNNDAYTTGSSDSFAGPGCPGVLGADGNISADPLFISVSPAAPTDFTLQLASPAVDAGDNTAVGVGLTDFAGAARIQNAKSFPTAIIDMGIYEHAGIIAAPPAPDFALTASPTTVDLTSANSATVQLTLTPNSSLQAQISSACAGLPAKVQCSFAPPTVSVNGGVPQTMQLTLTASSNTTAAGSSEAPLAPAGNMYLGGVAMLGALLPVGLASRTRRRRRLGLLLAGGWLAAGLVGCVHLNSIPAPATTSTSTITVTATASTGQQHQATLTVKTS